MRLTSLSLLALMTAACASGESREPLPSVATSVPTSALQTSSSAVAQDYRIGPADKLKLAVFQVPDLSFNEIVVDASGNLQMPLVGSVRAAGLTPAELSVELQRLLGERYLRNPQVSVTVSQAASQKVTVDGAVKRPGVYEMRGRTTLIQAVAMAEGPTNTANLRQVAVFRNVDDRLMVAKFDLRAIRAGQAEDPVILGDDRVVVDTSQLSANIREVLGALPAFGTFVYLL